MVDGTADARAFERSRPSPGGRRRKRAIVFVILSAAMSIGAFVPLLVDLLQDGRLTWSLYALGALLMAWLILAPWFLGERSRAVTSWAAAALTVPSYLLLVQSLSSVKGWLLPLGLPAAALGLAGSGAIVWLWSDRRIDRWYAAAATVFVLGLLGLTECLLARPFLVSDPYFAIRRRVILSIIGTSIVLGLLAFLVNLRRRPAEER
jgi:hypothetical protein